MLRDSKYTKEIFYLAKTKNKKFFFLLRVKIFFISSLPILKYEERLILIIIGASLLFDINKSYV